MIALLRPRKITTTADVGEALGISAYARIFRKVAGLDYRTSYGSVAATYTLDEIAGVEELGLWSFRGVWFSRFGTRPTMPGTLQIPRLELARSEPRRGRMFRSVRSAERLDTLPSQMLYIFHQGSSCFKGGIAL
jgi:hypothetical protein